MRAQAALEAKSWVDYGRAASRWTKGDEKLSRTLLGRKERGERRERETERERERACV